MDLMDITEMTDASLLIVWKDMESRMVPLSPKTTLLDAVGISKMGVSFLPKMERIWVRDSLWIHLKGIAFRNVCGAFYPAVGVNSRGASILVNFGQMPFLFDPRKSPQISDPTERSGGVGHTALS